MTNELPVASSASPPRAAEPNAAEPSATESLARLRNLIAAETVWVEIDRAKLSSIDFPLAVEADGNRLAYGAAIPIGAAFWWGGPIWGFAALALAFLLYQTWGRRHLAEKLRTRIETAGLVSLEQWRKVWRFGGLMLVAEYGQTCEAPDGRWMSFVAEVMAAKAAESAVELPICSPDPSSKEPVVGPMVQDR